MKTRIIALEPHDDLISVRDRLSWAKTPRILLIWPKGEPVDLRPLDLRVLQRHADTLGAQLAIVTRGDSIRRQAEALGLPVFESSASAQREAWPARPERMRRIPRPPRRDLRQRRGEAIPAEAAWRTNLFVRVAAFILGVLAVLALVGVFVPRASVTLHPESRTQSLTVPVSTSLDAGAGMVLGTVPAREEIVVLKGTGSMDVTGHTLTLPLTKARGVARFRNLSQTEVEIPAGTVIFPSSKPEVRFKTLNLTHLTAGVDEIAEVPVEAEQAGSAGNLEAGMLQSIEGQVGLLAVVDNPEPTRGGSDRQENGPNEQDRRTVLQRLTAQLLPEAQAALTERLGTDEMVIEDTGRASQVLEAVYDPPAGQPGEQLNLEARIEFSFRVVSFTDLTRLAESALNGGLPKGFEPAADPLTLTQAAAPRTDNEGVTRWQMRAERRILRSLDPARIAAMLRGRNPQEAQDLLMGGFTWDQQPVIALSPSWWPWMPLLPFRTAVTVR